MSARFALDLLHPGHVADSWQDWFIGPQVRVACLSWAVYAPASSCSW
jgi:hypothetical protein